MPAEFRAVAGGAGACEPGPGVAKSWDISPDGLTYTFHLRDNAKWSDGTPVTAHDFWYSFRRCLHPSTGSEYSYELWYLPNAENYSTSKVKPGDKVVLCAETPKGDSLISLREIVLGRDHEWNGCAIRDLDLSRQTYIVMVRRAGTMLVPRGSTKLQTGDTVLLYSKQKRAEAPQTKL